LGFSAYAGNNDSGVILSSSVMYRLQLNSGFNFRIGITPILVDWFESDQILPWPALSLGYNIRSKKPK